MNYCRVLWMLGFLIPTTVAAAEPLVAVHPLVVLEGDAAEAVRLEGIFKADLASRNIDLVKRACVEAFLRTLPRPSCAADEECLARLARTCVATRAVYVAIVASPQKIVLSGKVVRATGLTERTVAGIEVVRRSGPQSQEVLREGIRAFLSDDLKVDFVDLQPLVEASTADRSLNGKRIAGITTGSLALAAAFAGGAVWLASIPSRNELRGLLGSSGFVGSSPRAALLDRTLTLEGRWTAGLLISAGALAASSVVLLVLSRDPPPGVPQVSVGATDRELGFVVSGSF